MCSLVSIPQPGFAWTNLDFDPVGTRIRSDPLGSSAIGLDSLGLVAIASPPLRKPLRPSVKSVSLFCAFCAFLRLISGFGFPAFHLRPPAHLRINLPCSGFQSDRWPTWARICPPSPPSRQHATEGGDCDSTNTISTICQRTCIPGFTRVCQNQRSEFNPDRGPAAMRSRNRGVV